MRRFLFPALFAATLFAAPAQAESSAPLSLADPTAFVARLKALGYNPDPIADKAHPGTAITVDGSGYMVAFGGCENGLKCTYLVLVGKYSDVKGAPADWIAKENSDFDYIKVWNDDDGMLTYSTGLVVEGMSADLFKSSIDLFVASGNNLAKDAMDAKLTK